MAQLGDTTVYGSVDAHGFVTRAKQPAFSVYLTASQYIVALSTWYTIIGWTELFNTGNHFNPTTGLFTAPVTGKYQLCANVDLRNLDSAAGYYWIRLMTSNSTYGCLLDPNFTADMAYRPFSVSILADMDAGDEAYVYMYQSGGTANQTYATVSYTTFSGFLVC